MKKEGLFRSIIRAVVMEEKKRYVSKPMDLILEPKKHRWYRIMDFIESQEAEAEAESQTPNA